MNRLMRPSLEIATMVAVSAVLYVEFFHLNNLIFAKLEHIHGVNWVFLPAGFRVLLVLGMGWAGLGPLAFCLAIAGWTAPCWRKTPCFCWPPPSCRALPPGV